jgi:hypothetical protein
MTLGTSAVNNKSDGSMLLGRNITMKTEPVPGMVRQPIGEVTENFGSHLREKKYFGV